MIDYNNILEKKITLLKANGQYRYFLDVNNLTNGIYILRVFDKLNASSYIKLLISK